MRSAIVIFLSLPTFTLLFLGFFHPVYSITQDLGRHILTGKIIVETYSVPKINLYSYTNPDFPFINHHYLSEVIFYLTHQLLGFQGLLLLALILIIAAFGLIYFFSFSENKKIIPLTLASILYLRVLFERTDIRPEIFSFLFLSIFIVILFLYKKHFTKLIFLLIPLQFLWAQMHIYFIIGIFVIFLFLIDLLFQNRKKLNTKQTKVLLFVFICSCLVILINPNGLSGALLPFSVLKNYGYTIEENQSMFLLEKLGFSKSTILYFKITVLLLFSSLLVTWKKSRPIDWFLAISFTIIAAFAVRNFPLFVFATFLPFVKSFSLLSEKVSSFLKVTPLLRSNLIKISLIFLLLGAVLWQTQDIIKQKGFGATVPTGAKKTADFFLAQNLKGPIFNNFDIGSYLEYRVFPKEKVFVDGRPEAYPMSFFKDTYIPMQENKELFEKVEKKYHFNTIFFAHTDQTPWAQSFLGFITKDPSWKLIYGDDYVIIFVKNTKENEKYRQISRLVQVENSFEAKLRMANFYNLVGWRNEEIALYKEILSVKPTFCPALYNLATIYAQQNNPISSLYQDRFTTSCQ